jgi:DNA topoisomerase-1
VWDWPVAEHCPQCDSPILVVKATRAKGRHIACPNPKCRYTRELDEQEA